jgi:hypothetical protein
LETPDPTGRAFFHFLFAHVASEKITHDHYYSVFKLDGSAYNACCAIGLGYIQQRTEGQSRLASI